MQTFGANIGTQGFGNDHAAVGLLVVFDDRHPGAPHGQARCRSACGQNRSYPCPIWREWTRGAPGRLRNSSRKRFLCSRSGREARLPGRRSWRRTRPCRRWRGPPCETAGPGASGCLRRRRSASRVRPSSAPARVNFTSSTFWNWCWRMMPRTSRPYDPASLRKQGV